MSEGTTERARGRPDFLVSAHARVHLGLLQLSREFGTANMGVGFALERPRWLLGLRIARAGSDRIWGEREGLQPSDEFEVDVCLLFQKLTGIWVKPGVDAEVLEAIPSHVGLGSKTALLCGVLAAKAAAVGRPFAWPELRGLTGRGGTSGIGINTAVCGGFILDAGHGEKGTDRVLGPSAMRSGRAFPAIAGRWALPEWPLLLVTLPGAKRYYGHEEALFFGRTLPLSRRESERVAGIVLFDLLPAVVAGAYEPFTAAVRELQDVAFKTREWSAQDTRVRRVRRVAEAAGADCVALSSLGPTLVVFGRDVKAIREALQETGEPEVDAQLSWPRNSGIEIQSTPGIVPESGKS